MFAIARVFLDSTLEAQHARAPVNSGNVASVLGSNLTNANRGQGNNTK